MTAKRTVANPILLAPPVYGSRRASLVVARVRGRNRGSCHLGSMTIMGPSIAALSSRISERNRGWSLPVYPGRNGFPCNNMGALQRHFDYISDLRNVRIASLACHIPNPETCDPYDPDDPTLGGARSFIKTATSMQSRLLDKTGLAPALHLLSSASSVAVQKYLSPKEIATLAFDRIGSSLFGNIAASSHFEKGNRQVMHVLSFVSDIVHRPYGSTIGYSSEYRVENRDGESMALIGAGWYSLGREYRGKGQTSSPCFLTNLTGGRHILLGRQSMNILTIKAMDDLGRTLRSGDAVMITSSGLLDHVKGPTIAHLAELMDDCQNEHVTSIIGNSPACARFWF